MTNKRTRKNLVFAVFALCLGVSVVLYVPVDAQQGPYYPPPGAWAKKAPAELGLDPVLLQQAVDCAKSRESNRAMDFSDQERIFGTLLGSVPNIRAKTNGVVIYKGYVSLVDQRRRDLQGIRCRRVRRQHVGGSHLLGGEEHAGHGCRRRNARRPDHQSRRAGQ